MPVSVRQILIAAIVLALVAAISSYRDRSRGDLASCYTDKPVNIVMCVDVGAGHHSLMETFRHPPRYTLETGDCKTIGLLLGD